MIRDYRSEAQSDIAEVLVARGAVQRGRHLRFACPVHDDRHPSADYEPTLGVWVCRSCGAGGGRRHLAERLGLAFPSPEAAAPSRSPRRIAPPPPQVAREAWAQAWPAIVDEARRQERRLAPYRQLWRLADWLRSRHQAVTKARRLAAAMGEDHPRTWPLLALAARVSTEAAAIGAMLDDAARRIDA